MIVKLYLGTEVVCGLRVKSWRNKNGMARPLGVDFVKSSVILSDHENLVLMLLPRNADQPVVEERKEGIAYGAYDQSAILSDELGGFSEGIVIPFGGQRRRRRRVRVWKQEQGRSCPG